MRIIAGKLGGRLFNSPHGHRTHPMSDKMRGAIFNMLGDISGMTVFDPFAGSGALSFEAVSRGAASTVTIECDRRAQRTIKENIELLDVEDRVQLIRAYANAWLNRHADKFDIVLLDPPYDALQPDLLDKLLLRCVPDGRIVLSWPGKTEEPRLPGVELLSVKRYGDASLYVYRPLAS